MKKVSSIFLLLLYLSTFTEMHQLLCVPVLFAHFHEHQLETKDISFLDYIAQHYTDSSHSDKRHQDLPFKHKHCEIIHMAVALVPDLTFSEFASFSPCTAPVFSYEPQLYHQSKTASIWQPPRYHFSSSPFGLC